MAKEQPPIHLVPSTDSAEEPMDAVGTPAWTKSMRTRAHRLARQSDQTYMMLAQTLWQIFDTPADGKPHGPGIYTKWGFTTFTEYAESELGIEGRKAERLKHIWFKLNVENGGLKLTESQRDRLIKLGWCKVREMVGILTVENAGGWIDRAEKCVYATLAAEVVRAKEKIREAAKRAEENGEDPSEARQAAKSEVQAPTDPAKVEAVTKSITFYDDQWQNVELAIEKARIIATARGDKQNHGYLLDLICTEFLATNNIAEDDTAAKVAMLTKLASMLGVKLAIIDPGAPVGEKVIFGLNHIEELQRMAGEAGVEVG